jgi:uncharacterized protein (TIGR02466 family)
MALNKFFATPIYDNIVKQPVFDQIQSDFDIVVNDLKNKNSFQHKENWTPGTHRLSDVSFRKNLLDEYKLDAFREEIMRHVMSYTQQLGVPPQKLTEYKILQCWMTNTRKGEYTYHHNHGRVDISGVYYYKTNGHDGSITFNNPVPQFETFLLEDLPTEVSCSPAVGKIILFPGWLYHSVGTNHTDNERISVAFNISFKRHEF